MYKVEYFDMYYPVLGIKRTTYGIKKYFYITIETNPITGKYKRCWWDIFPFTWIYHYFKIKKWNEKFNKKGYKT